MALPHHYQEAIDSWNELHPDQPFQPISGPTFTLTQMGQELGSVMNMTMDNVIQVLMNNCIPVPWINHSYVFSLHYLDHHHDGCSPFHGLFNNIDDDHLAHLNTFRVPPIIPEWDGWWVPSSDDIVWLHTLWLCEEKENCYCQDDSE
jgi:hypothetical protein